MHPLRPRHGIRATGTPMRCGRQSIDAWIGWIQAGHGHRDPNSSAIPGSGMMDRPRTGADSRDHPSCPASPALGTPRRIFRHSSRRTAIRSRTRTRRPSSTRPSLCLLAYAGSPSPAFFRLPSLQQHRHSWGRRSSMTSMRHPSPPRWEQ